ncbi:AcrR family transcriptional regulator [Streptomyces sp. LBL]|nr:AcrR family transcriptional regulator [Streptomyces sp. LBL]
MRYPKERKHQTRRRIITTAGRRLEQDGIDGSGVASLMKDAGLTAGTFYAYFASKDDLVATAVADQLRAQHANIVAQAAPGRAGLEQIIRWYFSPNSGTTLRTAAPTPPSSTRSDAPRISPSRPTPTAR